MKEIFGCLYNVVVVGLFGTDESDCRVAALPHDVLLPLVVDLGQNG